MVIRAGEILRWSVMLIFLNGAGFSQDQPSQAGKTLCNQEYKLFSIDGKKELGSYAIKALHHEANKTIEIIESINVEYRGKKAELESTLRYNDAPLLTPKKGAVETKIDGKVCMKGSVTFHEKSMDTKCTGFTHKRTGAAIKPPAQFNKKGLSIPKGVLIFQSALPVIGPHLLPKAGTLKNIIFVEFPDDLAAPELINVKEGFRLVREKADDKGEYNMKLYSPESKDAFSQSRFDKDDRLLSIVSIGNFKFVKVEKKSK